MLKTYDSSQAAFIERDNNKYYDATQGAWLNVPSVKTYDPTEAAWVERLYKYLSVTASKTDDGATYSLSDNGRTVYCQVNGVSDDFFRFTVDGLNIPSGSTISFTYEPDYWDCMVGVYVYSGTGTVLNTILSTDVAGEFTHTLTASGNITTIEFVFSAGSSVDYMTGAKISNVKCGNLKFKFS